MERTFKQFKTQALSKPDVRKAFDQLSDEFAFLEAPCDFSLPALYARSLPDSAAR